MFPGVLLGLAVGLWAQYCLWFFFGGASARKSPQLAGSDAANRPEAVPPAGEAIEETIGGFGDAVALPEAPQAELEYEPARQFEDAPAPDVSRETIPADLSEVVPESKPALLVEETIDDPGDAVALPEATQPELEEKRIQPSDFAPAPDVSRETPPADLSEALPESKPWFVIRTAKGQLRVCQLKNETPQTVAGPFANKKAALEGKGLYASDR